MKKYNYLELCDLYKVSMLQFSYVYFYMYSASYSHILVLFMVLEKLISSVLTFLCLIWKNPLPNYVKQVV